MSTYAIRVDGLGKAYRIGAAQPKYRTIRETVSGAFRRPFARAAGLLRGEASSASGLSEEVHALREVSFRVEHGEVLGIIGRNGAGKSTLLKILARITRPSSGQVRLIGRIGSLLEVGTGFHPELSGRENIYLNGAVLGMRKVEIDRKFDEIVAFSETEKFLDTPVKHYSSGMTVRLAFSVAAHLEPEILIVDEVLAVGDLGFQKKCLGKMGDVAGSGRTILFVSHNMAAISALCSRAIMLSGGRLVAQGHTADVIGQYVQSLGTQSMIPIAERTDRDGDGRLRFTSATFLGREDRAVSSAVCGDPLTILLGYETADGKPARNVDMDVAFYGSFGQLLFFCKVELGRGLFETLPPQGTVSCYIPRFPLNPGRYRFKLWCGVNGSVADRLEDAGELLVEAGDFFGTGNLPRKNADGIVMVEHNWDVCQEGREPILHAGDHARSDVAPALGAD